MWMSDELRRRLEGRYPMTGVYASSPVTAVTNIDAHPLGEYKLYSAAWAYDRSRAAKPSRCNSSTGAR